MDKEQFIPQLEMVLEIEPGTLRGDQKVRDLEHWDSLKLLEILALADEQLHAEIDANKLAECVTIDEMLKLLDESTASKNLQK
jgi:acyl carrier protein